MIFTNESKNSIPIGSVTVGKGQDMEIAADARARVLKSPAFQSYIVGDALVAKDVAAKKAATKIKADFEAKKPKAPENKDPEKAALTTSKPVKGDTKKTEAKDDESA